MKRSVPRWQLAGFLFTCIAGTLLHFAYDWSGQSLPAALFSAVNESIWEHMKLLYFPMLLFAVVESRFLLPEHPDFWCVKLMGITAGLLLIPTVYYTYTGILGTSADWFNITIFFIAAALSYGLETRLLKSKAVPRFHPGLALFLLCLMGAAFMVLTFLPPHIPLFQDPRDGTFGRSV